MFEHITANEIAGYGVGALLLCATISAPKIDSLIAASQRSHSGPIPKEYTFHVPNVKLKDILAAQLVLKCPSHDLLPFTMERILCLARVLQHST
ncbi:hypothetical protein ACH5RR_010284 [Cinchona calisaya]|uniref:Uncharacterized protein n=1 Tax=Cinchona calisaya TaxID=153742 RepID=A0ABD3AI58_9GENT